jgi:hypothetical protein
MRTTWKFACAKLLKIVGGSLSISREKTPHAKRRRKEGEGTVDEGLGMSAPLLCHGLDVSGVDDVRDMCRRQEKAVAAPVTS